MTSSTVMPLRGLSHPGPTALETSAPIAPSVASTCRQQGLQNKACQAYIWKKTALRMPSHEVQSSIAHTRFCTIERGRGLRCPTACQRKTTQDKTNNCTSM